MLTEKKRSDWRVQEEPIYRLKQAGLQALSDKELMGILIGDQNLAEELFEHYGSLRKIRQAVLTGYGLLPGMCEKMTSQLRAAFYLGQRHLAETACPFKVNSSQSVANYLRTKYEHHPREIFGVLFLNNGLELIHESVLFTGGLTQVVVDVRIIFRQAVSHLASSLILFHNHPSGNLRPSEADRLITQKITEAGKLFDIQTLDHIIISHRGYYSFADEREI